MAKKIELEEDLKRINVKIAMFDEEELGFGNLSDISEVAKQGSGDERGDRWGYVLEVNAGDIGERNVEGNIGKNAERNIEGDVEGDVDQRPQKVTQLRIQSIVKKTLGSKNDLKRVMFEPTILIRMRGGKMNSQCNRRIKMVIEVNIDEEISRSTFAQLDLIDGT